MYLFPNIRKKRAIKSYVENFGKDLAKRYGKSKTYTPAQVVKTIHDEGYNWRHICYAHALYVSVEQFQEWHEQIGENCDYEAMREEIAVLNFGGNVESLDVVDFAGGADSFSSSDAGGSD